MPSMAKTLGYIPGREWGERGRRREYEYLS